MSAVAQQKPQLLVKLTVVNGPHVGQTFNVNKISMTIGRGPENDIVLMNDPQISRSHAQIILVDREFEIIKLSQKNAVVVHGESVDKWKLLNNSTFTIGDSEIKIEYDLGQAVSSVSAKKLADVVPLKSKISDAKTVVTTAANPTVAKSQPVATKPISQPVATQTHQQTAYPSLSVQQPKSPQPFQPQMKMQQQSSQQKTSTAIVDQTSLFSNPKFKFYAIAAAVILLAFVFIGGSNTAGKKAKTKPILKYEDEIDIKMRSEPEKDKAIKREELRRDRNSPQHLRAEENFIKGMRDYQLGNYSRAIEFFQVVLNLESDHVLARRHLQLSLIRFDELVQTKLMLGESYYSKHNFSMCESMYRQVMDMLADRKSDTKYKLAESKAKECSLADEGIR